MIELIEKLWFPLLIGIIIPAILVLWDIVEEKRKPTGKFRINKKLSDEENKVFIEEWRKAAEFIISKEKQI